MGIRIMLVFYEPALLKLIHPSEGRIHLGQQTMAMGFIIIFAILFTLRQKLLASYLLIAWTI